MPGPNPFSLVVSATAFHWVDPAIRVGKAARALRAGGWLAIVDTHWGVGEERDAFGVRSQACFQRWEPDARPGFLPPTVAELATRRLELEEAPDFASVERRLYRRSTATPPPSIWTCCAPSPT